ncbi:UNVERIFIED_CONTAM: hypothetical protein GTU68_017525, partial [Idotea baltica]|nr:hypothetical protein [Idotea baltica]
MFKMNLVLLITSFAMSSALLEVIPVRRTPEERFDSLSEQGYPWPPNYLNLRITGYPHMRMHYLDLGPKDAHETILLLHGTPAWSFLYRLMIPHLLKARYRVVAPDFIGFGRSDKLSNPQDYTHKLHVLCLLQLVQYLDLQGVTLFGHDLGGPTGLSVVRREKDRFRRLALFNTWIPQGDIFSDAPFTIRHTPYLLWRFTTQILGRAVPLGLIFNVATDASSSGVQGYTAPFPTPLFTAGPSQWPLLVPIRANDPMAIEMQKVKTFLSRSWTGPVLFGFSDGELFTVPGGDLMRRLFRYNG